MKALVITAILGLAASACATETTGVRLDEARANPANLEDHETVLELEERVSSECKLPPERTYFRYNSARVEEMDNDLLRQVARCMNDGELRGESIIVAGYTDPRGSEDYNETLGMDRAQNVANYLVTLGVAKERIYVKSFGERRAEYEGRKDEDEFARQRKVDIIVADPE